MNVRKVISILTMCFIIGIQAIPVYASSAGEDKPYTWEELKGLYSGTDEASIQRRQYLALSYLDYMMDFGKVYKARDSVSGAPAISGSLVLSSADAAGKVMLQIIDEEGLCDSRLAQSMTYWTHILDEEGPGGSAIATDQSLWQYYDEKMSSDSYLIKVLNNFTVKQRYDYINVTKRYDFMRGQYQAQPHLYYEKDGLVYCIVLTGNSKRDHAWLEYTGTTPHVRLFPNYNRAYYDGEYDCTVYCSDGSVKYDMVVTMYPNSSIDGTDEERFKHQFYKVYPDIDSQSFSLFSKSGLGLTYVTGGSCTISHFATTLEYRSTASDTYSGYEIIAPLVDKQYFVESFTQKVYGEGFFNLTQDYAQGQKILISEAIQETGITIDYSLSQDLVIEGERSRVDCMPRSWLQIVQRIRDRSGVSGDPYIRVQVTPYMEEDMLEGVNTPVTTAELKSSASSYVTSGLVFMMSCFSTLASACPEVGILIVFSGMILVSVGLILRLLHN